MSREIKFRGKRIDNGKWIYGGCANKDDKAYIIIKIRYSPDARDWDTVEYYENHPTYTLSFVEVFPDTVGQYIGAPDKNGKEIYEGDIVKIHQFLFDGCEYEKEIVVSIEYMEEMACFGANLLQVKEIRAYMGYNNETGKEEKVVVPLCDFCGLHGESFEVIGNIYENSDLLKEAGNE